MCSVSDHECAVGRRVRNTSKPGWQDPCPAEATMEVDLGSLGVFEMCTAHAKPLVDELYERLVERPTKVPSTDVCAVGRWFFEQGASQPECLEPVLAVMVVWGFELALCAGHTDYIHDGMAAGFTIASG